LPAGVFRLAASGQTMCACAADVRDPLPARLDLLPSPSLLATGASTRPRCWPRQATRQAISSVTLSPSSATTCRAALRQSSSRTSGPCTARSSPSRLLTAARVLRTPRRHGLGKFDAVGMWTVSAILVLGSVGIGLHSYNVRRRPCVIHRCRHFAVASRRHDVVAPPLLSVAPPVALRPMQHD
jgi:hypothetical protein